jgi:hypothetical protein
VFKLPSSDDYSKLNVFIYALSLVVFGAILYENLFFVTDDTFITFRYAQNLLDGNGLVYNAGQYVEGYTNFLFVLLLAFFKLLGAEFLATARVLSLVSFIAIYALVVYYIRIRTKNYFLAAISGFFMCASYPFVTWVMGAMEGHVATLFVTVATVLLLRVLEEETVPSHWKWVSGGCFALAYLTRPDMVVFPVAVCAVLSACACLAYKRKQETNTHIKLIIALLAPVLITLLLHYTWRWFYYGQLLPNTYYAKVSGISLQVLALNGVGYVWSYILTPPFLLMWTAITALCVLWSRQEAKANSVLLAMIAVYLVYVIRIGGDWMPIFRFFVPLFPLIVLLAARSYKVEGRKGIILVSVIVLHITQITNNHIKYRPPLGNAIPHWGAVASYINENWEKGATIAINMSGYVPYKTMEFNYLDMLGLHDKHIAHREIEPKVSFQYPVGHMKGDGEYVLEQRPDYIIVGSAFENESLESPKNLSEQELLASKDFFQLYEKIEQELMVPRSPLHPSYTRRPYRKSMFSYYKLKKN